jgi:hypothetical protein
MTLSGMPVSAITPKSSTSIDATATTASSEMSGSRKSATHTPIAGAAVSRLRMLICIMRASMHANSYLTW